MNTLLERARELARRQIAPRAAEADAQGHLDPDLVQLLAREGWLGLNAPSQWGGAQVDTLTLGQIHALVGQACTAARSLLTVQAMVIEALARWGTRAQKERWLPGLASGQERAAFAMSEPEVGSDAANLETRATATAQGWRLRGHKAWISFGCSATLLLVFARVDQGALGAFLVPAQTPHLARSPMPPTLGVCGGPLARVTLEGCALPHGARLRGGALPGLGAVGHTALHLGRLSVAWGCVGMMERALRMTTHHTRGRLVQGQPLARAPQVHSLLAQMALDARASRALCAQASRSHQARAPQAASDAVQAKLLASQAANRVLGRAVQLHGASGALRGHPIERLYRDARLMEIIEGPTQVLESLVAQTLPQEELW